MLTFEHVIQREVGHHEVQGSLTLPSALRERSRQRVVLASGQEAGLILPRGTVLRHGDLLQTNEGYVVRVEAAEEPLSVARFDNQQDMARACLHLGNRHVPLEVGPAQVQYIQDKVLDDMLQGLGFAVEHCLGPFQPEPGACPLPHIEVRSIKLVERQ